MQTTGKETERAPTRPRGRPRIYKFDELQPGECLLIEGKRRDQIAASISAAERRTGFALFAYHSWGGVRVCRYSADREQHMLQMKAARQARRLREAQLRAELRRTE